MRRWPLVGEALPPLLLWILLVCSTSACGGSAQAAGPPGRLFIVGIDISGSRTPTQLREGQQLLNGIIDELTNGDKLVLVETYQGGTDAARQWDGTIPSRRTPTKQSVSDTRKAERFRRTARTVAGTFFDSSRAAQIRSTDLFGTLARSADYARADGGRRTTVLLLSDMAQATREVNMEAGRIPDQRWIADRKAQGRLPDLRGVCVFAVGADVTTERGARIRKFWRAYFAATGATFQEHAYRNMVSDAGEIRCE